MILRFPNQESLLVALSTDGLIPSEIVNSTAKASWGLDRSCTIEAKFSRKMLGELGRFAVVQVAAHVGATFEVSCWPQVLPVTKERLPDWPSETVPILFQIRTTTQLASIVAEILRLGNDRQAIHWVQDQQGDCALLQVIGPPYYTLLRTLDNSDGEQAVYAYREIASRVWIQLGYSHPLANRLQVPNDQCLLLKPSHDWQTLPSKPFRDLYDVVQFQLPAATASAEPIAVPSQPIVIPLSLIPGETTDSAELWILRRNARLQLDDFIKNAEEKLLDRLRFVVVPGQSGEMILIRALPTKQRVELQFADVEVYKTYQKLPNLFIPLTRRLHPHLRRDAVRQLLVSDNDHIIWLTPTEQHRFQPESIRDDAFRPLRDWVEYIIDSERENLHTWIASFEFAFDPIICKETQLPAPDRRQITEKIDKPTDKSKPPKREVPQSSKEPVTSKAPTSTLTMPTDSTVSKTLSNWEEQRRDLENRFLALGGYLDSPERQALWPELAALTSKCQAHDDACINWLNVAWNQPEDDQEWLTAWLTLECPNIKLPLGDDIFNVLTLSEHASIAETRRYAVILLTLLKQTPPIDQLRQRLPDLLRNLQSHEAKLPIRALWLITIASQAVTGSDPLGVARVRDRILQRLLQEGLNPERNVPSFLRYASHGDVLRIRALHEKIQGVHEAIRSWVKLSLSKTQTLAQTDNQATLSYIDLMFSYGMARLSQEQNARTLLQKAQSQLQQITENETESLVARFLSRALSHRVENAIAGNANIGLLPTVLIDEYESYLTLAKGKKDNPHGVAHYVISRFRQQSRILEPQEKLDPYQDQILVVSPFHKSLAELPRIRDHQLLARRIRDLFQNGPNGQANSETRFHTIYAGLPLAGRVGEAFAVELVGHLPNVLRETKSTVTSPAELIERQGKLLADSVFLAAHFDRRDLVQQLMDLFIEILQNKPATQQYDMIHLVTSQFTRSLRKLGLMAEFDRLLQQLQTIIQKDASQRPPGNAIQLEKWYKSQLALLALAGGWLTFGLFDKATPIMDETERELLGPETRQLKVLDFTTLTCAFIRSLGQSTADFGLPRIIRLIDGLDPLRVTNTFTSARYYSRLHLNLAEEIVLAMVSDEFGLSATSRRWIDEDEYLIRRRIHQDMKALHPHPGMPKRN